VDVFSKQKNFFASKKTDIRAEIQDIS